jgi:hypothetical protein
MYKRGVIYEYVASFKANNLFGRSPKLFIAHPPNKLHIGTTHRSTHINFIFAIALHSFGRGPVTLLLGRYLRLVIWIRYNGRSSSSEG